MPIKCKDYEPLQVLEEDFDMEDDQLSALNLTTEVLSQRTGASRQSSRDPRFMLGYTPIPFDKLQQSCDFIQKWVTFHMPSIELKRYPEDVIFKNGS